MTAELKGIAAYHGQSYAKLERIAFGVRSKLAPCLALDDPLPVLDLFERLDDFAVSVRGREIRLTYGVEALRSGLEALAYYSADEDAIVVALDEETYAELLRGANRPRFTVMHEIGHGVLHPAELIDRALATVELRGLPRAKPSHEPFLDTEWQANGFAAAMLSPARGLRALELRLGALDAAVIAAQFEVSLEAATRRLALYRERRDQLLGR